MKNELFESATDSDEIDVNQGTQTTRTDVTPSQILRDGQFYLLWILFLFGGTGAVFLEAMYKVN